ncbi:MAG: hypothetical protein WCW44_01380 [archaeon]|jgi:hypothetical protein
MDTLAKEFFSTFVAGFLFLIVFMANPSFAHITQEAYPTALPTSTTGVLYFADSTTSAATPASNPLTTPPATSSSSITTPIITVSKPMTSASNNCAVSKLSPTEAKDIMNLTHEGFDGKNIGSGQDGNAKDNNVKDLGPQSLVGKDNDGKQAVKVDAPSVAVGADRFSFLAGIEFNGPFGVGLILDDTLRVGRCDLPTAQQKECKIMQEGLATRTSGVGFKADMVNAFQSLASTGKSIAQLNLSSEDANKLKANYLDINSNDFQTGSFAQGEYLKNSIKTNQYTAKNATTCNNSACTISTYSAFDKYFNAWLTTDMVVTNVGPTLLGKANKFFMKAFKTSGQSGTNSWMAGVARIREKFVGTPQAVLKTLTMPASKTIGQARIARFKTLVLEEGFEDVLGPLYLKKKLFSTGAGGEINAITKPESPIWKYTPEKRAKFFEAIEHLTAYTRENRTMIEAAMEENKAAIAAANAITDPVVKAATLKAAKIDYGQKVAVHMDDWDEILAMDFEDWLKDKEEIASLGGLAVRQSGVTRDMEGYVDIATAPPFNLKKITQKFGTEGSWSGWANSTAAGEYKVAEDGVSLELFRIKPEKLYQENVGLADLKLHVAKMGGSTYSVRLPDGRYLPLNTNTVEYISGQPQLGGAVNIYESAYVPSGVMTPEDFATRITHQRIVGRPATALRNMEDLRNALVQNDFAGRKYYSLLDQQFAQEGDMVKAYFKNPQTALWKGSVLPIVYWEGKRGFGNEDYSMFMLPDTWTTTTISQGSDKLYKDSFTDFYANEGSDQGDMFKRVFNSAPFIWNKIIEQAAATNQFTSEMLTKVTGGFLGSGGMRDTVGDVAFYSHNENCSGCTVPIAYEDNYFKVNGFSSGVNMQAFLLEATDEATKKKSGSTLISYTHHSDLSGKTTQIDGGKIDLSSAASNEETCDAVLRKYHLGFFGNSTGGVLGLTENAAYFFGFGPGLIATFVQQMTVGRALQDCVDDKEGYYVHFYAPPEKEAAATKSKEIVSNETVSTALSDMSGKLDSFVKEQATNTVVKDVTNKTTPVPQATPGNPVENSMDKLKDQFQTLTSNIKKAAVLQAAIELMAPSTGTLMGKDVFYVWFKGSAMPNSYRTTGADVITDGNMSVKADRENGTLTINGKTVLDSNKADHVRMMTTDTRAAAEFVPVTLNKVAAPMNDSTVFELNTSGEVRVLNSSVISCIQKSVFDQTGITYSGNELTQVFGKLSSIKTEVYGAVIARNGKILLEGSGPRAEGASSSKFIVNGYWASKLVADGNNSVEAGKFLGMTFEHGSIILNTETNELIVYLRQHKDSVLNSADVKGLSATPTTIVDPETGCTQPAIDLEAIPQLNDELGAKKVENFNTSMNHLGPFTQFTTDKKIYEFYSKKDANSGDCKNYFRVRDKDTGKILTDSEIVGGIKVNDDGSISFTTADGKQQNLKFDAENGVPKVSYNGGTPETLLSAQGPNGSFWYDPEKGLWYPENGLRIPLNQSFKDNGAWFAPDKNGNVSGTGDNKMTFNIGQQEGSGFNIPSMPETAAGIVLFASAFLIVAFMITQRTSRTKKKL